MSKKYTTIQMKAELYSELKEYCKKNGRSISGLVEVLVKERIHNRPTEGKVLRVKT